MQILFDNVDLTVSPYTTRNILHESSSPRELGLYNLARERGGLYLTDQYRPKTIKMSGIITGNDAEDLEKNIDDFKELMSRGSKNLDITYTTGMRRYVATAVNVTIERDYYHLSYAPFEVEFSVPSGIGKDLLSTTETVTGITDASYSNNILIGGSTSPKPTITITFTAEDTATELSFLCNGNKITLTNAYSINDVVVIDCENKKVTLNGTEKDYTGIFPLFLVGTNTWTLSVTRTSATLSVAISYYNTYI